jgi:protein phosphatase
MDTFHVPAGALVVLAGPPASGKTTWASTQVASGAVSADSVVTVGHRRDSQEATRTHARIDSMLRAGRTVVCDGPNITADDRGPLLAHATRHDALAYVVRFAKPLHLLHKRNQRRANPLPNDLVSAVAMRFATDSTREQITAEGFTVIEGTGPQVRLLPSTWDGRHLTGGFDIVGDVHGSLSSLRVLLEELGYDEQGQHPHGRLAVLVGDVHDKGRHNLAALEYVMGLECIEVMSNHSLKLRRVLSEALATCRPEPTDAGLARALADIEPELRGGLGSTVAEIRARRDCLAVARRVIRHIDRLSDHVVLDEGALAVAHAGATADMIGSDAGVGREARLTQRAFLYGPPATRDGDDEPVNWVDAYDGETTLVHGHTIQHEPRVRGNVVSIDTGCYAGGGLTAYRWPERAFVTVPTHQDDLAPVDDSDVDEVPALAVNA